MIRRLQSRNAPDPRMLRERVEACGIFDCRRDGERPCLRGTRDKCAACTRVFALAEEVEELERIVDALKRDLALPATLPGPYS